LLLRLLTSSVSLSDLLDEEWGRAGMKAWHREARTRTMDVRKRSDRMA
jgi:hypothetical protein